MNDDANAGYGPEDKNIENYAKNTGMSFKKWYAQSTDSEKGAGLYCISVKVKPFGRYIKVGLGTDVKKRLLSHLTTLKPIEKHVYVHAIAIKPNKTMMNVRDRKTTVALKRSETRLMEKLAEIDPNPLGEWFKVPVKTIVSEMINLHFGRLEPEIMGDGANSSFWVYKKNGDRVKVDRELVNEAKYAEHRKGDRKIRKKTYFYEEEDVSDDKEKVLNFLGSRSHSLPAKFR